MSTPSAPENLFEMFGELKHGWNKPLHCAAGTRCQAEKSNIVNGDLYFVDKIDDKTYCSLCGRRLRYHRKKASERGEDLPVTFEDVEKRHAA